MIKTGDERGNRRSDRCERPGVTLTCLLALRQRFVLAAADDNEGTVKRDKLAFIFNFFDELRRLAPPETR